MTVKIYHVYYVIQSSNHQKIIEEKNLAKYYFMTLITHLCRDIDKSNGEMETMSKHSVPRICFTLKSDT